MNSFEWIWQYAKKNKNKLLLAVIFVVINAILIVIWQNCRPSNQSGEN